MEVIFMDKGFKTTRIVDAYTSLIWKVNYIGYGAFELRFPMDDHALTGIRLDWYASIRESDRYMIVEGIQIDTSLENGNMVTIAGRSLESILDRRIIREDMVLAGNFIDGITKLVNANAITPSAPDRKFSRVTSRARYFTQLRTTELNADVAKGENLYDVIYNFCDANKIGFRIIPEGDGGMVFELYCGIDRSYNQDINPWVVFSPQFENIKDTRMVMDTSELKTVCIGELTFNWKSVKPGTDDEIIEEEKTLVSEYEAGLADMERREVYWKSSIKAENTVDKSVYGKAKDMVNIRDYQEYQALYFDSAAYKTAMAKFNEKASKLYVPKTGESTVSVWVPKDPSDPTYVNPTGGSGLSPDDPMGINGSWELETIPGDTIEEHQAKNQKYYDYCDKNQPNKEDFMVYGWVLVNEAGYNSALAAAQAQIDAAYEAAVNDQLAAIQAELDEEVKLKLSEYQTISQFDGELDANVQNMFGEVCGLGDLVQIVNEFGMQAVTRITGMTYSEEEGVGIRNFPEFTSDDRAVFDL